MDTNEKIKIVGTNIQEKANLIWNVANSLFGAYKPHEYGLVILPMVVIKRFHDCLLPTREKVLATYEKVKQLAVKDGFLRTASGYRFYNTSQYTFERLKADPENIKTNFEAYINGFSDNVIDILANMVGQRIERWFPKPAFHPPPSFFFRVSVASLSGESSGRSRLAPLVHKKPRPCL